MNRTMNELTSNNRLANTFDRVCVVELVCGCYWFVYVSRESELCQVVTADAVNY